MATTQIGGHNQITRLQTKETLQVVHKKGRQDEWSFWNGTLWVKLKRRRAKADELWYPGNLDIQTITWFGPKCMLRKEASKSKVGNQKNGKRKETLVRKQNGGTTVEMRTRKRGNWAAAERSR
jgi:hypothetical protein